MWRSERLRRRLAAGSPAALNLYAVGAAFTAYFCMYAFRKPFAAATYEGLTTTALGATLQLKTTLVVSQVLGYATAKFLGIKFCSEARRGRRALWLVAMIAAAEGALVLLAVVPVEWKPLAMFLNGLPLGMVWGLVVQYLEGRRTSDFLLAGLCCSFILASGVVKDVGRGLMAAGDARPAALAAIPPATEFWMPAVAGALFLPLALLAIWLLDHLPDPTAADRRERCERAPMDAADRRAFLRRFWPGLALLVLGYFLLTALRDFRDNYMVDVLQELGYSYDEHGSAISRMELLVSFVVLGAMGSLILVRNNVRGLAVVLSAMVAGFALIGGATYLKQIGAIDGLWWMTLLGTGAYLAYVPYNAMLFDRLFAATQTVGTAVFAIYVADAIAYVGSVAALLLKDHSWGDATSTSFLMQLAYVVSAVSVPAVAASGVYFWRRKASPAPGAPG
ncbi:MAG: hypothetical protein KF688_14515 [Pirellulales bacterium]|nr:hypothetical protein [Pirellulales bacterium]